MEKTKTFKELVLWQKAHELTLNIYKITRDFPKEETYALTSQVRRASVSIAANIAEGYKKKTKPHKLSFLNISEGSLEEVKYYLFLSKDLEYINKDTFTKLESLSEEVGRILNGYSNSIRNN
jgi:four helix bundle protein